jgi:hypothetical protein
VRWVCRCAVAVLQHVSHMVRTLRTGHAERTRQATQQRERASCALSVQTEAGAEQCTTVARHAPTCLPTRTCQDFARFIQPAAPIEGAAEVGISAIRVATHDQRRDGRRGVKHTADGGR